MSAEAYYRQSNSSEDSPLQDDRSESDHDGSPSPDDHDDQDHPLDPRNSALSLPSAAGFSLDDRRHSRRRDFDRRSLTNRDLFKYLMEDSIESKKMSKILRAALERLDGETRRAQEAERRALELAQRFKIVNEARMAAQQELDRTHAELRMYKVQLDNAQREILRGSDLLKDIEAQRDSAEAAAARARTTARRLKEEQLVLKAKEEGRREGYREGLQRGYQQARVGGGLDPQQFDVPPAGVGPFDSMGQDAGRTDPLDGIPMRNFQSPPPPNNVPLSSAFGTALPPDGTAPPVDNDAYGAGAQGSRFREIIGSPSASTLRSAPPGSATRPGASSGWPQQKEDDARYMHPTPVHNAPPSPQHADYAIPPDGYIPAMGPDNIIPIPPPHELARPASMSSMRPSEVSAADDPSRAGGGLNARDYAYPQRQRASPRSYADSLPSTTISQFDLVTTPRTATRGLRDRSSGLSAIPEVSSSMEFSPGTEGRVRSGIYRDSGSFPAPDPRGSMGDIGSAPGMTRSRSRETNQRIADELRYSDPEEMEQWRRSTASQSQPSTPPDRFRGPHRPAHISTPSPLGGPPMTPATPVSSHRRSRSMQSPPSDGRSYLGTGSGSRDHHRTASSSAEISINIEPPSGPGSNISPSSASLQHGMLTPSSSRQQLPPQPTQPSSGPPQPAFTNGYGGGPPGPAYGYGAPNPPLEPLRYDIPPSLTPGVPPSPRRTPEPLQSYPGYPTPGSSSSSSFGRPMSRNSRGPPIGYGGPPNDMPSRSRTPSGRPPSAFGSERPPSARPVSPGQQYRAASPQPGVPYSEAPQRVPSVVRSPSRPSSRQSLQPEPARPSSRTSADHHRSLSLNAGSTPAMVPRPLSGASQLRRVPSASSINSDTSRKSGGFQHYDPSSYVDAAFLASTEDLSSMQSPNTMANTRANAVYANPGPSKLRASSPSMSYTSFRS
ncbi:hypothetical protein OH77DRAFT_1589842 [Trametes cingulata]|nr:hypothetical protein OH77DRAFT_1589842 [Trametes cingulata]